VINKYGCLSGVKFQSLPKISKLQGTWLLVDGVTQNRLESSMIG